MATASHRILGDAQSLPEQSAALDETIPEVTDFPCSVTQERFWLLDRLEPGNPSYNVAVRWRLEGRVSTQLLEQAWREIIARHEVLRTRFLELGGKPVQRVSAQGSLKVVEIDLSAMLAEARSAESDRIGLIEARAPFDLCTGPLLRVVLVRHSPTTAVLFVTTHQIVSDGWSIGVMARELGVIYEALSRQKAVPLEPLAIQYGDYARWQLEWLRERGTEAETAYWSRQLSGVVPFQVVADWPRPTVPTTNGAIASVVLPRELTNKMQARSAEQGVTLFSTALAALCATLARYTGKNEIVLGTQVSDRDQLELEPMIGQFVNSLILRNDVSGAPPFKELVQRISTTISEALEHRHIPIERLLGMVKAGRGGSTSPPVSVNFIFQRTFIENRQYSDFTLIDLPSLPAGAIYDLSFFMVERPDGWRFSCQFNTDQFEAETADRLLRYVRSALENAVRDPDCRLCELGLADPAETERLASRLRGPDIDSQPRTLHTEISKWATATPDAVALLHGDRRLTFAQLEAQSRNLAARLQVQGVGPGKRVAICLGHSTDLVVATLATLRAGGTCALLDPASRDLQRSIERSAATLALTTTTIAAVISAPGGVITDLAGDAAGPNFSVELNADSPAFAWLTGSGQDDPLSVEISSRASVSRLASLRDRVGLSSSDTFVSLGHTSPEAILVDYLLPLMCGARVVIPTVSEAREVSRLQQALRRSRVTVARASAETLPLLLEGIAAIHPVPRIFCDSGTGGESVSRILGHGIEVWALHGGLETAGCVSARRIQQPHELRLLGEPLGGIRYVVLDAAVKAPPVGAAGKLYIAAAGVTAEGSGRQLSTETTTGQSGTAVPGEPREPTLLGTADTARVRADGSVEIISEAGGSQRQDSREPGADEPIDPDTERELTALWVELLGPTQIDPNANFFELGGHSLLAARMLARVEAKFGRRITLAALFRSPSIRGLAHLLRSDARDFDFRQVVKLQADGASLPLIAINNTGVYYLLARRLGPQQPVTSLQVFDPAAKPEKLPATLEEIASEYVKLICRVQPNGPFVLAGWCVAGALTFEIACQLVEAGHQVRNLFLIDSWVPRYFARLPRLRRLLGSYSLRWQLALADWRRFTSGRQTFTVFVKQRVLVHRMGALFTGKPALPAAMASSSIRGPEDYDRWLLEYLQATTYRYEPRIYPGRITLFRSTREPTGWLFDPLAGWGAFAAQGVQLELVEGNHFTMFQDPGAVQMAERMSKLMADGRGMG